MDADHPFVGRASEIARIRDAAERVAAGRTECVIVEGLYGVGKTALVRHALEPYREWHEVGVVLTPCHREMPGSAVQALTQTPPGQEPSSEELATQYLRAIRGMRQPTIINISQVHFIDDVSADALRQVLSVLAQEPVLIVITARPTERTSVHRLQQVVKASPRGAHIGLRPLSVSEVRKYLSLRLGLPVSAVAARMVEQATSGLGHYLKIVAEHLVQVPLGRREVGAAINEALRETDLRDFSREYFAGVEPPGPVTRLALNVLATAGRPLERTVLSEAVGADLDYSALKATQAVKWNETGYGYQIECDILARALYSELSPEVRAGIHRRLAELSGNEDRLRHEVAAHSLVPLSQEAAQKLHSELMGLAEQARRSGHQDAALRRVRLANDVLTTETSLSALARLSVSAADLHHLPDFENAVRHLVPSTVRAGLLALIALHHNEPQRALVELESHGVPAAEGVGLVVYAHAVGYAAGQLVLLGSVHRAAELNRRTREALDSFEQRLLAVSADRRPTGSGGNASVAAQELTAVRSVRALLLLWHELDQADPNQPRALIGVLGAIQDRLRQLPGAGNVLAMLNVAVGTRMHTLGDLQGAHDQLLPAASTMPGGPFARHAQVHMALVLFSAGLWDEAAEWASGAVESTLHQPEEPTSLMAYAASALVPAARGEYAEVAQVLEELAQVHRPGPAVTALVTWVHAWAAIGAGRHRLAVEHLHFMRDGISGWWTVGAEPAALLARSLHYGGWPELMDSVERSLVRQQPVDIAVRKAAVDYVRGFRRWTADEPEAAFEHFAAALEVLDREPPLRRSQAAVEVYGHRLYRALLGLDMAHLISDYPQRLGPHRPLVIELVVWSAAVFRTCGAAGLVEEAAELAAVIRPQAAGGEGSNSSQGISWVQYLEHPQYSELSPREREIAHGVLHGKPNRMIAEELVISVRTVEYHVANVLAKFGLRSRKDLRRVLYHGPGAEVPAGDVQTEVGQDTGEPGHAANARS